jgi:predicted lysophospholipase L1 biosynthesis ABC-type transport system permease subunit
MRLVIAGTLTGMIASALVAQWIASVTPTDEPLSPWIWIAAPLTLALAVMIAAVLPARRALASDPLMIMKDHQ